jgi:predicted sulfurtransferase
MYNKMKECNKCKVIQSIHEFRTSKSNKDGYMKYCKKCHNIQIKNSRHKYVEYDKQYAKDNWLKKKIDP